MWTLGVTIALQYPPRKQCLSFFWLYPTYDEHFNYLCYTIILRKKIVLRLLKSPHSSQRFKVQFLFSNFPFFPLMNKKKDVVLGQLPQTSFPKKARMCNFPQEKKDLPKEKPHLTKFFLTIFSTKLIWETWGNHVCSWKLEPICPQNHLSLGNFGYPKEPCCSRPIFPLENMFPQGTSTFPGKQTMFPMGTWVQLPQRTMFHSRNTQPFLENNYFLPRCKPSMMKISIVKIFEPKTSHSKWKQSITMPQLPNLTNV